MDNSYWKFYYSDRDAEPCPEAKAYNCPDCHLPICLLFAGCPECIRYHQLCNLVIEAADTLKFCQKCEGLAITYCNCKEPQTYPQIKKLLTSLNIGGII